MVNVITLSLIIINPFAATFATFGIISNALV